MLTELVFDLHRQVVGVHDHPVLRGCLHRPQNWGEKGEKWAKAGRRGPEPGQKGEEGGQNRENLIKNGLKGEKIE